jgi:hypothetical protein
MALAIRVKADCWLVRCLAWTKLFGDLDTEAVGDANNKRIAGGACFSNTTKQRIHAARLALQSGP